jgi:vacuolar-type H+-ATPase subunit F/Vma7
MMERDDVGLLLLSSRVAEMVRHLSARRVDDVLPVVLEVPEKDAAATSLASDPVFQRVAQMLGEEGAPKAGGAAGGRGE